MRNLIFIIFVFLLLSCSSNNSEELTFSNTEILNTDVKCEEFDTHVYCISKSAPVAKKYPKWGTLTGYSPEVFCSTDLPLLVCTETTKSLLAAMMEWGSYGLSLIHI